MKRFIVKIPDKKFGQLRDIFEKEECVDFKDNNSEVINQLFYVVIKDGMDVLDLRGVVRIRET
jgi:hypothetical protein